MDVQYMPQHGPQPAFYYYSSPEQTVTNRNQGYFTPQPTSIPMHDYFQFPMGQNRPQSAGPGHFAAGPMPTPCESPKFTSGQKPHALLQHENNYLMRLDTSYIPPTPTLSAGSSIANGSFSAHSLNSPGFVGHEDNEYFVQPYDVIKPANDDDVFGDALSQPWTGASPPMTPGMSCLTAPCHVAQSDMLNSVHATQCGVD